MIDTKLLRDNPDQVKRLLARKGAEPETLDELLLVDRDRRRLHADVEQRQARLNDLSKEVGRQFGQKKVELIHEATTVSDALKRLKPEMDKIDEQFEKLILTIPNIPAEDVPTGNSEADNRVLRQIGQPKKFDFSAKDHLELGEKLSLIDMARGAKVAEARFAFLKSELVLLQFALIQWGLQKLIAKGFIPTLPPYLVNQKTVQGTGYLPVGIEEVYKTADDNLYLVGTAEQPLVGMHQQEILDGNQLPLRYVGFSPAFRREAGTYGKDLRGIFRLHQFEKLEMVSFVPPENSAKELEFLLAIEEEMVQELELPYQVIEMCTADLGMQAAKKFDVEAWLPSQQKYRETHSTSNTTDYQARRLNIRFKRTDGTVELVHTLNGTAVAIGRMLIAIMENYQQADGSISIPPVLRPLTGFDEIKE